MTLYFIWLSFTISYTCSSPQLICHPDTLCVGYFHIFFSVDNNTDIILNCFYFFSGNIALHVFSKEARKIYDLDTLWAVGPKYDDEFNKPEPISDMLEKHSMYLQGLEPAS